MATRPPAPARRGQKSEGLSMNNKPCGTTRRGFLLGAAAGLPLGWLAYRALHPGFSGRSVEVPRPALAMPGPFPGRVVEGQHPGVLDAANTVNAVAVRAMMQAGMSRLVGGGDVDSAWRRFFQRDDV